MMNMPIDKFLKHRPCPDCHAPAGLAIAALAGSGRKYYAKKGLRLFAVSCVNCQKRFHLGTTGDTLSLLAHILCFLLGGGLAYLGIEQFHPELPSWIWSALFLGISLLLYLFNLCFHLILGRYLPLQLVPAYPIPPCLVAKSNDVLLGTILPSLAFLIPFFVQFV